MTGDEPIGRRAWFLLAAVSLVAVAVRCLAYTGFFGSDEVTYITHGLLPLDGDWRVADYVGANRLGMNLPIAASAWLFGRHEWSVALYPFLCSVAEVALVTWFGMRTLGVRGGVLAGLLLATLPVHVHFAGRIMADAPLALSITAAFVLFFEAERRSWTAGYFWAGLVAGVGFWVKPVTLFVFAVLVFYPVWRRAFRLGWGLFPVGVAAAIALNGVVMKLLTGSFLYVFESIARRRQSGYLESEVDVGRIVASPFYYFEYLFLKIYHTGLVGVLAAAGLWLWLRRRRQWTPEVRHGADAIVFWGLGLIGMLSFTPASLDPLIFIPKQTNYMLMFVAPLCLLGGMALASLGASLRRSALLASTALGLGLAMLLQATVTVFTANSWAVLDLARSLPPGQTVAVMSNSWRAAEFQAQVGGEDLRNRVVLMEDAIEGRAPSARLAVVNVESMLWEADPPLDSLDDVPTCWVQERTIHGHPRGLGVQLARGVQGTLKTLDVGALSAVTRRLAALTHPRPAYIYRISETC